jgi:hypothetical protein
VPSQAAWGAIQSYFDLLEAPAAAKAEADAQEAALAALSPEERKREKMRRKKVRGRWVRKRRREKHRRKMMRKGEKAGREGGAGRKKVTGRRQKGGSGNCGD